MGRTAIRRGLTFMCNCSTSKRARAPTQEMRRMHYRCLYRIRNSVNGWSYIGLSQRTEARFAAHRRLLEMGRHTCLPLQADWDRHGDNAFVFEVIKGPIDAPHREVVAMERAAQKAC